MYHRQAFAVYKSLRVVASGTAAEHMVQNDVCILVHILDCNNGTHAHVRISVSYALFVFACYDTIMYHRQ